MVNMVKMAFPFPWSSVSWSYSSLMLASTRLAVHAILSALASITASFLLKTIKGGDVRGTGVIVLTDKHWGKQG